MLDAARRRRADGRAASRRPAAPARPRCNCGIGPARLDAGAAMTAGCCRSPRNACRWSRPAGWPMSSARCRRRWRAHGWDMRVLLPAYSGVDRPPARQPRRVLWREPRSVRRPGAGGRGRGRRGCRCCCSTRRISTTAPGGIYGDPGGDYPDNPERFAALCWAAAAIAGGRPRPMAGRRDVLHAHDWQGGLAPAYLRYRRQRGEVGASPSTTSPSRGWPRPTGCRRCGCPGRRSPPTASNTGARSRR